MPRREFTDNDAKILNAMRSELQRLAAKVDNFRGPGVTNSKLAMSIGAPGVEKRRAGGCVGSQDNPDTIGSAAEGSEAADTGAWDRAEDQTPVDVWIQTRTAYYHAGDKKLYGYFRKLSFDSCGKLYAVSAETRVEIDAPEDC